MKGTLVNRILSRAIAVAGSMAVIGGAVVAAAAPAGAIPPTRSWGVSANGLTHIFPVAEATPFFTPATSSAVVVPGFITTGGILDRVSSTAAFSNVGSPKIYLGSQYNQFNATNVMSSCRNILGIKFGQTTIQAGAITGIGLPNIPILRNPAPNTKIFLPGFTLTFNRQTVSGGIRTVTAIYVQSFLQNLSVGVSRC
jgi:hypothetical protein